MGVPLIAVHERNAHKHFANSGLIGNGTLLMYEISEVEGNEQLYSPLLSQSVSGEMRKLNLLPHEVTSWSSWFSRNPETTSIAPVEGMKKRYRKSDPRIYFGTQTLYFPVAPMPPDEINPKTPIIAIESEADFKLYSIPQLIEKSNEEGIVKIEIGGKTIRIKVSNNPIYAVAYDADGTVLKTQRVLWMNWYALHPGSQLQNH